MRLFAAAFVLLSLHETAFGFVLRSRYKDQHCLDLTRAAPGSWRYETNAEVWPCHGGDNQQIELVPYGVDGSHKTFLIKSLGKCLDLDMGFADSWTHGTNVQFYACNGGPNQVWRISTGGAGYEISLVSDRARCLDIDLDVNSGWRYEHNVQLWKCNVKPNQGWYFEDLRPDGSSGGQVYIDEYHP